jgi:amino acid transporter
MPLMFMFVVIVGLPTGCVVAGRYVQRGLDWAGTGPIVAAVLLALALLANLAGRQVGGAVQLAGSTALVATGVFLIISGLGHATQPLHLAPSGGSAHQVLPGVLLAFWAFVGFENLTFLGRDLRRPARDFLPVSIAALTLYGVFAIGLTLTIAVCIQQRSVDPVAGLLQLATDRAVQAGVALVAVAAMLINSAAWVRGVDRLMVGASHEGQLPALLHQRPFARTALLATLFTTTLAVLTIAPDLTVDALAASSAVFVLIYLICIIAYLRTSGVTARTILNALLIPIMTITLIQSGTRSTYGLIVTIGCLVWCRITNRGVRPQRSLG